MSLGGSSSKPKHSDADSKFKNAMDTLFFGPVNWQKMQREDLDPLSTLIHGDPKTGWRPRTMPLPDTKIPELPTPSLPIPAPQRTVNVQLPQEDEKKKLIPTLGDVRRREFLREIQEELMKMKRIGGMR